MLGKLVSITTVKNNGYGKYQTLGKYLFCQSNNTAKDSLVLDLTTKDEWWVTVGLFSVDTSKITFSIKDDILTGYNTETIYQHNYKTNQQLYHIALLMVDTYPCLTPNRLLIIHDGYLRVYDFTGKIMYSKKTKYQQVLYNWVNGKYIFISS